MEIFFTKSSLSFGRVIESKKILVKGFKKIMNCFSIIQKSTINKKKKISYVRLLWIANINKMNLRPTVFNKISRYDFTFGQIIVIWYDLLQ